MQQKDDGLRSSTVFLRKGLLQCLWLSLFFVTDVAGAFDAIAEKLTATVVGTSRRVPCRREGAALLLDVNAAAEALAWKAAVVSPGRLLTICRDEKGGACIPVRLTGVKHASVNDRMFVDATVLAGALRFSVDDRGHSVTLRPLTRERTDESLPAYNAAWPKGRGFRVGNTLPDIPLYDMDGKEVRFSRFLGKQYILYCWASW